MTHLRSTVFFCILALCAGLSSAQNAAFTGNWKIDLRTPEERKQKVECGEAYFDLSQVGDKVTGDHVFATAGCGRMNEGGKESVKGVAMGKTAILVVTSGRTGTIVLGRATRVGRKLQWATLEEIKRGEPEGDSALILGKGLLSPPK